VAIRAMVEMDDFDQEMSREWKRWHAVGESGYSGPEVEAQKQALMLPAYSHAHEIIYREVLRRSVRFILGRTRWTYFGHFLPYSSLRLC